MDHDLPQFEPIELPPFISDAQVLRDRQHRPESTEIAHAEALCHAGDVGAATATITRLLHTGTHAQDLQFCLLGAILSESQDLVRVLLDAGVPASLVNVKSAIRQKSLSALSLFLQHGWDINEQEEWCELDITPLSTAVELAPLPIIKQLFAHCPLSTLFQGQLLHCAARRTFDDAEDVLRLVLARCQPDLNTVLYEDDAFSYEVRKVVGLGTALHEAARTGRPSVVQMLIQKGADVSIRDSRGNTALEVAEFNDNHAAVALLRCAERSASAKM